MSKLGERKACLSALVDLVANACVFKLLSGVRCNFRHFLVYCVTTNLFVSNNELLVP